jgi:NADP-dependent 3-hydroxy acid dehydrogenase YdfG
MPGRLDGQVALVTGASSGIGEATALALAAEGARIAAAARRSDRLDALVKRIEARGGQALPLVVDVANEAQVRARWCSARALLGAASIFWSTMPGWRILV